MPSDLSFLPDWATLVPFLAAGLALNLTPGADMAYIALTSTRQGARAGATAAFGIIGGSMVHCLAAAIGISALIMASQGLFTLIKYAGAAYLLYLAWKMLRPAAAQATEAGAIAPPAQGHLKVFGQAALVNLLNPKVGIFMMAFLPQFADPARGHIAWQILVLGALFNLGSIPVNVGVAVMAGDLGRRLRGSSLAGRLARWLAASVMGGLAVRLALSERT